MKNFLTSMLGALVALLVFTFCAFMLLAGIAGALISIGTKNAGAGAKVENGSYLVFDLSSNITDAPPSFGFGDLKGDRSSALQLRTVTRSLRMAAVDDRIAGILVKGSFTPQGFGSGYGALQEIRSALARFRASGKPVKAYLEFATTKDYYVASVANQITLDPFGLILMPGLATEPAFFAGAFEKYGVGVQVTRVGKYKSFVEPFVRKDMSPENREETQRLLDDLWNSMLADIGRVRKVPPAQIQSTVDAEGLIRPVAAESAHLVDRVAYRDQVIDELKAETGRRGSKESFKQVSLSAYTRLEPDPAVKTFGRSIAVVYAEGDIVDGEGEPGEVGGDMFSRELRKLRQDESVKAIVLRVNSPGGSASASEAIQREIRLARDVKPVIVSMGTYAASGGYWISAYGDRIFAEPTTITGSIGVFGIQFDIQKLANDFGVTFDGVKTGKFADSVTITRPKTAEEIAVLQRLVDWIYGQFVGKVAEGRKLKPDYVEGIAQGRVWSGAEAAKLGLVDEIGGLEKAIAYAAKKADLRGDFRIVEYPRRKDAFETIAEFFGRIEPEAGNSRSPGLLGQVEKRLGDNLADLKSFNDPRGVYARLPIDLRIR